MEAYKYLSVYQKEKRLESDFVLERSGKMN